VDAVAKEGWYEDPADRHERRWFSQGTPTDLVMDGGRTSRDPISISDPEMFQSMALAAPPDDGPLLIRPGQTPSEPDIRPGPDPAGLRYAAQMKPGAVQSWRWPMVALGAVIVCEFLFGLSGLTAGFMLGFTALALVPLLFVGSTLRARIMQRQVWQTAVEHDPSIAPLLASWRLIKPADYLKAAFVLAEAAVVVALILRQFRG
jgi:hypothetical protein